MSSGKAIAEGETEGFTILADSADQRGGGSYYRSPRRR